MYLINRAKPDKGNYLNPIVVEILFYHAFFGVIKKIEAESGKVGEKDWKVDFPKIFFPSRNTFF